MKRFKRNDLQIRRFKLSNFYKYVICIVLYDKL